MAVTGDNAWFCKINHLVYFQAQERDWGEAGRERWQGSKGKEKPVHKAIGAILGKNMAWVRVGYRRENWDLGI